MGSQKAWYWLAAGMLVFGINSEYQSGKLQWAQRYVRHSIAVANEYAQCAGHYLAQFGLTQNPPGVTAPQSAVEDADLSSQDAQRLIAREQVRYALAQAEMARRELERHRPEIEKALTQFGCRHAAIEMARQGAFERNAVPVCRRSQAVRLRNPQVRIPEVRVEVPQVRVEIPRVKVDVPPQLRVAAPLDDDDTL